MINNHNYSNTSKQIIQHHQQQQQQQSTVATTDALIIQSNTNVVTDEFMQQLQEQFGGENKQIYVLNTNSSSGGTSLTTVGADSSASAYNQNNSNNNVQYIIVDKDVDINLILQDPNIFNNNNQLQTQQPQQIQHQQIEPLKQQQSKQQFITNTNSRYSSMNQSQQIALKSSNVSAVSATTNNPVSNNQGSTNQMLAVEESIQRVQVPPPKRKQFELKLENKKNSYQDVFLRYLAGEKQPTLEIMQSEYAHNANKKPKDNLNYSSVVTSAKASTVAATTNPTNASTTTITSSKMSNPTVQTSTVPITVTTPTTVVVTNSNASATGQTMSMQQQQQTINLDKENYYNSSRRENLLPLNNYEYRNSYKDHYDNQGVRVNPAVLKNLSYSTSTTASSSAAASTTTTSNNNNAVSVTIASNANNNVSNGTTSSAVNSSNRGASVNLPAKKLNEIIASSVPVSINGGLTNQTKSTVVIPKSTNTSELFSYSTNGMSVNSSDAMSGLNLNENKSIKSNIGLNSVKLNDLVQSAAISTTTKTNNSLSLNNSNNHHDLSLMNSHLHQQQHPQQHQQQQSVIISSNIIEENGTESHVGLIDQQVHIHHEQQQQINHHHQHHHQQQQLIEDINEEITFSPGEFLIHKSTFSGDFDNYDIWCVRDDGYLQKYEPVLLATGERCHQSADVLAQYTPDKNEFVLVKVEEKGKTEQENIVVGVLINYEPKNRKIFNPQLINANSASSSSTMSDSSTSVASTAVSSSLPVNGEVVGVESAQQVAGAAATSSNVLVVTYDDLKATLDVFLQALLSQNLNSEFLIKLKEIQDEYFKPSIEFIDSILNEKYALLMSNFNQFMTLNDKKVSATSTNNLKQHKQQLIQLETLYKYLIETKPKLISQNVQTESRCKCQALVFVNNQDLLYDEQYTAQYLVKFAGHPYSQENLLPIDNSVNSNQLDKDSLNKEFLVCAKTLQFTQLCHTVKHLKINFYEICQQKIEIVKQISSNSGAPEILNDCLADTQWLMEMFEKFKQLLFEIDTLIQMTQNEDATNDAADNNGNAQLESQALLNHHLVVDQVTSNLIEDIQMHS